MANEFTVNAHDVSVIADTIRTKGNTTESLTFPEGFVSTIEAIAAISFHIIGSLTRPANPKNNTIWINTDQEITDWSFSPSEPISPFEGLLWFETIQASVLGFNALDNHELMIYPITVFQYLSGAWEQKTFMMYQNDTWVEMNTYLLRGSNDCKSITGGYARKAYGSSSTNGSWSIGEAGLTMNGDSPTMCIGLSNFNPDSLKKYKTLRASAKITDSDNGTVRIGIRSDYNLGTSGIDNNWLSEHSYDGEALPAGDYEFTVDLTGIDTGYPLFTSWKKDVVFSKIWFE